MVFQDHIGKETGDKRHFPLGKVHHFGGLVNEHHGKPHERIGTPDGYSADDGLQELKHLYKSLSR